MEICKKIPFLKITYNVEGVLKLFYFVSFFKPVYSFALCFSVCSMALLRQRKLIKIRKQPEMG